jgi:ubiquinone/menaquinone biosynthesis C-methylase UbiE
VRLGVERLAPQPGEAILEVGPGTGHALLALARAVGPAGRVAGVDLSPGMLRRAATRLARAGLDRKVPLVCADAAHLPLPPSSFDAAFLSFTLELFDAADIPLVLGECRRVLRPSGRLCVVSLASEGGSRRMLRLYNWAHARFPAWIDCRPILPADLLQAASYYIQEVIRRSLWGLPVHVVRASMCRPLP